MYHIGAHVRIKNIFFQVINYFPFCLQIELYHCTKSQKHSQSGLVKTFQLKVKSPILGQESFLKKKKQSLSLLSPWFIYSAQSSCQISEKSLIRKRCTKFWAQFGIKRSHIGAHSGTKDSFSKWFTVFTFAHK